MQKETSTAQKMSWRSSSFRGAIGLELKGAVSRSFMMDWDLRYLKNVKDVGMIMWLYKRYIDDHKQVAEVPSVGSRYDKKSGKLITSDCVIDENDDARLAGVLKDIANDVMEGIEMEADYPSKYQDGKMPVHDMNVWMSGENGYVLNQHYEKAVSNKEVFHS